MIDYFKHNLDLILQARRNFGPHFDEEAVLADTADYVWDPEGPHVLFFNIPNDISKAAITTFSIR